MAGKGTEDPNKLSSLRLRHCTDHVSHLIVCDCTVEGVFLSQNAMTPQLTIGGNHVSLETTTDVSLSPTFCLPIAGQFNSTSMYVLADIQL